MAAVSLFLRMYAVTFVTWTWTWTWTCSMRTWTWTWTREVRTWTWTLRTWLQVWQLQPQSLLTNCALCHPTILNTSFNVLTLSCCRQMLIFLYFLGVSKCGNYCHPGILLVKSSWRIFLLTDDACILWLQIKFDSIWFWPYFRGIMSNQTRGKRGLSPSTKSRMCRSSEHFWDRASSSWNNASGSTYSHHTHRQFVPQKEGLQWNL